MIKNAKMGFTLIELLVVMSIIGILVGMSLFATRGARESARDGRRKADLETIRTAIELYRADCNVYPNASGNVTTVLDTDGGVAVRLIGSGSPVSCAAANVYLERIPNDIVSGRNYSYNSNGTTYTLCAGLEDDTSADLNCTSPPFPADPCGSGVTCSYSAQNP